MGSLVLGILKQLDVFVPKGNALRETSKNAECAQDIQEALRSIGQNMGMPYSLRPDDYEGIFNKGEILKWYYRDGVCWSLCNKMR